MAPPLAQDAQALRHNIASGRSPVAVDQLGDAPVGAGPGQGRIEHADTARFRGEGDQPGQCCGEWLRGAPGGRCRSLSRHPRQCRVPPKRGDGRSGPPAGGVGKLVRWPTRKSRCQGAKSIRASCVSATPCVARCTPARPPCMRCSNISSASASREHRGSLALTNAAVKSCHSSKEKRSYPMVGGRSQVRKSCEQLGDSCVTFMTRPKDFEFLRARHGRGSGTVATREAGRWSCTMTSGPGTSSLVPRSG